MHIDKNHPLRLQQLNRIFSKTLTINYILIGLIIMFILAITIYMLLQDNFIETYLMDGISTCLVGTN